jgi:DNA-binding GntR family transcriptional regulator
MSAQLETLRVLRSQSLPSAVQNEIERRILSGEVPAGMRISDRAWRFPRPD